jgi:hypothetical protein
VAVSLHPKITTSQLAPPISVIRPLTSTHSNARVNVTGYLDPIEGDQLYRRAGIFLNGKGPAQHAPPISALCRLFKRSW